jgi:tetratricopeptide (TPR) repeat protein
VPAALALTMTASVSAEEPPPDAGAMIERAREAAARDDHDGAIGAYEAAIAVDPGRQDELAVPLAAQRTWNGDYGTAIRELRAYTRTHGTDLEARLLLALALSWNDEPEAALDTYRAVLVHDPGNRDARFGEARMLAFTGSPQQAAERFATILEEHPDWVDAKLGQAMSCNWSGDHRKAARIYRSIVDEDTGNAEAWTGLATAHRWDGRADLAMSALRQMEGQGAASPASRQLERTIENDWRTRTDARFDFARDSDDFEIRTLTASAQIPWRYRGHFRASLIHHRFSRPGDPSGEETWLSGGFDHRASDAWQFLGNLDVAVATLEGSASTPWTARIAGRFLPGDRVRAELGYARHSHFSYHSFPERIGADQIGGALEVRLHPLFALVTQGEWARYEDDNERRGARAFGRWLARARAPRLRLEAGVQHLDHDEDLDNGIWTPRDYRALFARASAEAELPARFTAIAHLDVGFASDRADPDETAYASWGAGLVRHLGAVRLEAGGGHSESNVETGRGYSRSYLLFLATVGL